MDDLTSLCYFFANLPKRQQYFETFIDYHKDELSISDSNRKRVIGLAKTRWAERHKAYENYYILYRFVVATFESIYSPILYQKFYMELEEKHKEKWFWNKENVSKAPGFFAACRRFDRLVVFAVLYNGLEHLKPLVTKLQKRNQDIYQAYQMIDQVINDLSKTKDNLDEGFHDWYEMTCEIAKSVGVMPSEPRIMYLLKIVSHIIGEQSESLSWMH